MSRLTFLLDVDNTLLDNDRAKSELQAQIEALVGQAACQRFWQLYEEVREELDYVDFLQTLSRFRAAYPYPTLPGFPHLAALVLAYPVENWLYPGALEAVEHLKALGRVAILSDGDPVYQPAKIARAGLATAVEDRVLIYVHKEEHFEEIARMLPADRYVLVDDKATILGRVKGRLGRRAFTLHVAQGKYAGDPGMPPPDLTVAAIGDLLALSAATFD